jgi:hypothetical protein
MADYKVIPTTDPKNPYAVQTPDKVIANNAAMTKEQADKLCAVLNAFALHKPRRKE